MVHLLAKSLLTGFTAMLMTGCAVIGIEGAQAVRSEVIIADNIDDARAGDAEAQYKVGEAYCCSIHEGSGVYNTRTSVDWLCKAARQDYSSAMLMLGKIYSGDVIDGVRLTRRVAQGIAGTSTNIPVALAWFKLAKERGEDDADDQSEGLWEGLTDADNALVSEYYSQGLNAPCEWRDVIGE